jgi:hypothetical protein
MTNANTFLERGIAMERIIQQGRFAVVLMLFSTGCLAQNTIPTALSWRVGHRANYSQEWVDFSANLSLPARRIDLDTHHPRIALRVRQSEPNLGTTIPALHPQPLLPDILPNPTWPSSPYFVMALWILASGAGLYLIVLWMASDRFVRLHGLAVNGVAQ